MSSEASTEEAFTVGTTYPVPSNLYEAITGFKHVKHEDTTELGDDTEIIRLDIPPESIKDLLHVMINDILHDSEGARSAKGTRLSDHFNPLSKKKGTRKGKDAETEGGAGFQRSAGFIGGAEDGADNGLNQLIETFLYGMNAFYENPDINALRMPEDACLPPPPKLKRGRKEAEEELEGGAGFQRSADFVGGATTRSMAASQAPEMTEPSQPIESRRMTRSMVAPAIPVSYAPSRPQTRSQVSTQEPTPAPSFVFKALPSQAPAAKIRASRPTRPTRTAPVVKKTAPPEPAPVPETKRVKTQAPPPAATAPPRAATKALKSLEQSIVCDLLNTHYGVSQMNIKGVNESKELQHATRILKQAAYKVKHSQSLVKAVHTNYTTDAVLKSRKPYLVSYDAGSDLLNSILGQYGYVDISIVNVKDPGDSMRNRNKLHTSIEKIIHQHPDIEWKNLVLQLKSSASHLPTATRKSIHAFLEACESPAVQREVDIHVFYFHNYVATRVSECIKNKCMVKRNTPNILLGGSAPTPARILDDYKIYIHHKYNSLLGKERFVVHKKNIRFIVASTIGGQEFKLIDTVYYFDKAHHNRMRVAFRGAPAATTALPTAAYDRPELNSASKVGQNIKDMNEKLGGILGILHAHLSNPSQSLRTLPATHAAAAKKIAMTLYLECMFKFMGDFGQVLYCFYLGSVFASFDSSAVAVALTVMNILVRNPAIYKAFKQGTVVKANGASQSPGSGFQERMERGLILVTSTKYHGKAVPQVSYYTDYYASQNIQKGSKDLTPEQLQASLVRYFDEIQVERFDESLILPVPQQTVAPGSAPPNLELFNETVAITNVRVYAREEKHRILTMVNENNKDEIGMILIPQLMDFLVQSAPDIKLYKAIKSGTQHGGIYIAGTAGAELWTVIEEKVALFMKTIGTVSANRVKYIYELCMKQLNDYKTASGNSKPMQERREQLGKYRPHGGIQWIYIPHDKRYATAEYLSHYKRYIKREFQRYTREPTEEKRDHFIDLVDTWFRDVSRLSSPSAPALLLEDAKAIQAATHGLRKSPSAAVATLSILFNLATGQPEPKRARK